jgi:hypothetical protein
MTLAKSRLRASQLFARAAFANDVTGGDPCKA